jgi:hypothetical protein
MAVSRGFFEALSPTASTQRLCPGVISQLRLAPPEPGVGFTTKNGHGRFIKTWRRGTGPKRF